MLYKLEKWRKILGRFFHGTINVLILTNNGLGKSLCEYFTNHLVTLLPTYTLVGFDLTNQVLPSEGETTWPCSQGTISFLFIGA
jgi:hypothetical protein